MVGVGWDRNQRQDHLRMNIAPDQKMALYCPQCSGTICQQLLMMHGIAWYCIVLYGLAWCCMLVHGIAWYGKVLHGFAWYCMVLHGIE